MTYFYINGKPLTIACNRNKALMDKAKKIYFSQGVEQAEKFIKDSIKNGFRNRKRHETKEDIAGRRKALKISGSLMARAMGYSYSFYKAVELGTQNYSESFYKRFEKCEKKFKKLLTINK